MAKEMYVEFDGKEYTLTYTRSSVKQMEDRGFNANTVQDHPMTAVHDLFAGAFLANHRSTDRRIIDRIFDEQPDLDELASDLMEMYRDTFAATGESGEKKRTKNW